MRVCMLHNNYYRSSGSAIAINRIVSAMGQYNVDYYFAGCSHGQPGTKLLVEDFSQFKTGRYKYFNLMQDLHQLPRELVRFVRWLSEIKCDLIHCHHRRLACLANMVSVFTGVPVIYTCHNVFPEEMWFRILCPAYATGVSQSCADYLRNFTRARVIRVIYNPFKFDSLDRYSKNLVPRVVSVGRLEPVKGFGKLIEAWRLLTERGVEAELRIIGEGYLQASLQKQVNRSGLQRLITFVGYSDNIASEFQSADFNVLVSETEGFPNSVVEASAAGLPTLLTDVEGSRDTAPPNLRLRNRVKFGDEVQLADVLCEWFDAPDDVRADGFTFRDFLRGKCSYDIVASQYNNLYGGAVAKRK